ncbi:MAG: transcription termination factor NusA [Oscillospiraceae bacterium]|nr:transcription termination factor NusA [Oscillospiraceae bacterium]
MNAELFDAIELIERERGVPREYMFDKIAQALTTAYKRDNDGVSENIVVELDDVKREVTMALRKTVVDKVENPTLEISLEEGRQRSPRCELGDVISIGVKTRDFGRIAAQTAKQIIIQGLREAERGLTFQEFTSKEHELLTGQVSRIDPRNNGVVMEIGGGKGEKTEATLMPNEQVAGENLRIGEHVKVYVVEVRKSTREPLVMISRTHPGLVKRLFELEIPEIAEGIIDIKGVAREASQRTKIAVRSNDPNVDPIGACVGAKGMRVANIIEELRGEKIDIIKYSDDPAEFVAAALAPADVISVELAGDIAKSYRVLVPADQLSLAIGKEGQNARLAAKLTGCKIDIKPC